MPSTETVTVAVMRTGGAERITDRDTDRRAAVEPLWSWRQQALCHAMDSALFFAADGEDRAARRRREHVAKTICAACPVREPCASYALSNRELHGVWGGLSEADRAAVWRLADDPPLPDRSPLPNEPRAVTG